MYKARNLRIPNFMRTQLFLDPSFFDGRCAQVIGPRNTVLGTFGILHPEVMANFGLPMPCSAVEINIEPFL